MKNTVQSHLTLALLKLLSPSFYNRRESGLFFVIAAIVGIAVSAVGTGIAIYQATSEEIEAQVNVEADGRKASDFSQSVGGTATASQSITGPKGSSANATVSITDTIRGYSTNHSFGETICDETGCSANAKGNAKYNGKIIKIQDPAVSLLESEFAPLIGTLSYTYDVSIEMGGSRTCVEDTNNCSNPSGEFNFLTSLGPSSQSSPSTQQGSVKGFIDNNDSLVIEKSGIFEFCSESNSSNSLTTLSCQFTNTIPISSLDNNIPLSMNANGRVSESIPEPTSILGILTIGGLGLSLKFKKQLQKTLF